MPLKTPEVTVDWNPDGLPIATVSCPTARFLPSEKLAAGSPSRLTLITAKSVVGSVPTTWACAVVPSAKAT
jgi:hypothetical protein